MKFIFRIKLSQLLFVLIFMQYHVHAQVDLLDKAQSKTIDSLTAHWNKTNNPGGAIAIIKDGKVVYQNTLGYANVKSKKSNTAQTAFQLAQLSDSFIAYALLKLAKQGKLSLKDKLQQHLPYIAHLGKHITVQHLLERSSGLHDFEVLKNIVGWSDQAPFSVNDVERIIASQKETSFPPGTDFSSSRTNMVLAALVIGKVSGMNFEDYMQQHLFVPLKMENTFVLTPASQKNDNLAQSYRINEDSTVTPITSKKETYASINIASSIEDMVKWELHLQSTDTSFPEKFNEYVHLENGQSYHIPMGKLTYGQKYFHKERGQEVAMVTGGIDGYASTIFNFPDADFTVITLSNNGEGYNGYIGMLSAHEIIKDAFKEPTSIDFDKIKTIKLDPKYHRKLEGSYWDAEGELSRDIRIENDTLRYVRSNGSSSALIPLSRDRFQMKTDFDDKIYLTFNEVNNSITMQYAYGDATPFEFIKYTKKKYTDSELNQEFQGVYFSETLGIGYMFKTEKGNLKASNIKTEDVIFTPIMENLFAGDKWYLGSIEFQRNVKNEITGFYVRNDAIRNLWFKKVN